MTAAPAAHGTVLGETALAQGWQRGPWMPGPGAGIAQGIPHASRGQRGGERDLRRRAWRARPGARASGPRPPRSGAAAPPDTLTPPPSSSPPQQSADSNLKRPPSSQPGIGTLKRGVTVRFTGGRPGAARTRPRSQQAWDVHPSCHGRWARPSPQSPFRLSPGELPSTQPAAPPPPVVLCGRKTSQAPSVDSGASEGTKFGPSRLPHRL